MQHLLHITSRAAWDAAREHDRYRDASLASEGFIHCSYPAQVLTPANALFGGRQDLVLLVIDPAAVAAPIVVEDCYASGQAFPHLYGPLETAAVVRVVDFPPSADGTFALPPLG